MDDENNYVTHLGSNMSDHDLSRTIIEKIFENERSKMNKYRWRLFFILYYIIYIYICIYI